MKIPSLFRRSVWALPAGLAMAAALPAPFAAAAATINKGDTAWMLLATILVILMTLPGLALFYGGLARSKNVLSIFMQVFICFSLISVLWFAYGYSVAFSNGNAFFGGFSKAMLAGVDITTMAATFSKETYVPELVYVVFQLTFAAITPALIVGAFAERMKFSAVLIFLVIWFTFSYLPAAHMVWWWAGPDAYTLSPDNIDVVKATVGEQAAADFLAKLAAATDEVAKAAVLADYSAAASAYNGWLFNWGAIDFAGGSVVHINAGVAGLVCAIVLGKRVGLGKEPMAPHNLVLTVIGASLLWVGWFGFNAGSNLEASGGAALAMTNSFVATAAAAMSWMFAEWIVKGHPSVLGALSGAVAGLVAVTPAAGYAGPMGAIVLGLIAGSVCFIFCTTVKNAIGYDDSLDVFGVHCIGGIIGAILTGVLVSPGLGGTGITDYVLKPGEGVIAEFAMRAQVLSQLKAVAVTILWSGIGSAILYKVVDLLIGLRPTVEQEREGLDIAAHGERAYNY